MQKLLITVWVAALASAIPAHAGYISLNAPNDGGPTFTPLPGNRVEVSAAGGWGGTVAGYQPVPGLALETAAASFGPIDFIAGPAGAGNLYPATATASFNFSGTIHDLFGTVIAADSLEATISWNQVYFVDDGSYSVGPTLSGTGIVTTSTGDAAFEGDFPVGGTFTIGASFLSQCGRFPIACAPDQILSTSLINGAIAPIEAAPSPLIGQGLWTLLGAAFLAFVSRYCVTAR